MAYRFKIASRVSFLLLIFLTGINGLFGQGKDRLKIFKDSTDGAFDISTYLFELHGVIPIVSVITEPATGYGPVAAVGYFIPKEKSSKSEFKMPDIVGAGGGYTQNGTWFIGGGYSGFWNDDRIRYRGVLGYGDVNLQLYRNSELIGKELSAKINIQSWFFLQQVLFRIKNSPFMVGGKYYLNSTEVSPFPEFPDFEFDPLDLELISSGVGLIGEFETLNNVLSPSKGLRVHIDYSKSFEFLGSDKNFGKINLFALGYFPISSKWSSGLRIESNFASENTPFYSLPFLNLRGVPVMRYQGQFTLLAETEQFFNLYKRWGLVGFGGIGSTIATFENSEFGELAWNVGGGFRYKVARLLGLQMGMDVARGPEDWAFYIVFGSSWLK